MWRTSARMHLSARRRGVWRPGRAVRKAEAELAAPVRRGDDDGRRRAAQQSEEAGEQDRRSLREPSPEPCRNLARGEARNLDALGPPVGELQRERRGEVGVGEASELFVLRRAAEQERVQAPHRERPLLPQLLGAHGLLQRPADLADVRDQLVGRRAGHRLGELGRVGASGALLACRRGGRVHGEATAGADPIEARAGIEFFSVFSSSLDQREEEK